MELTELFDKFLDGQMSETEIESFELKCSNDTDFDLQFRVHKAIKKKLEIANENDLRKRFKKMSKNEEEFSDELDDKIVAYMNAAYHDESGSSSQDVIDYETIKKFLKGNDDK